MSMLNGKAATLPTARTDPANGAILLALSLIALALILPPAAAVARKCTRPRIQSPRSRQ
jgi:hypothetical protein